MRTDRSLRQATGWTQELQLRYPDVVILSGQMLIFDATERARAEAEKLAPWCLAGDLVAVVVIFSAAGEGLAGDGVPGGRVCVGARRGTAVCGRVEFLSLVPVLFTLGVAVDYGVYAASDPAWKRDGGGEGESAVGDVSYAR